MIFIKDLINQIREIAVKTLPLLLPFQTRGRTAKVSGALVVVGLAASMLDYSRIELILSFSHLDYLNGNINFDEVQQVLQRFVQLQNDSNTWWEFFEQVTYILVAVTVPMLTQMAMGRVMQSVNSAR